MGARCQHNLFIISNFSRIVIIIHEIYSRKVSWAEFVESERELYEQSFPWEYTSKQDTNI